MNQQLVETLRHLHAGVSGFPIGRVGRNHHIAKKIRRNAGERALLHGKRDDVGRACMVQIGQVEFRNLGVIHDQNGQLGIRIAQGV